MATWGYGTYADLVVDSNVLRNSSFDGPGAYYMRLDETSGTAITTLHQSSNGGAPFANSTYAAWTGTPTLAQPTLVQTGSYSAVFSGDDYITLPNEAPSPSGNRTYLHHVQAWVKTTAVTAQMLICRNAGGGKAMAKFQLSMNAAGKVVWSSPNAGGTTTLTSTTSINDGVRHFIAAGYANNSATTMQLWVDGVLEATSTVSGAPGGQADALPTYVGQNYDGTQRFVGTLDEVIVGLRYQLPVQRYIEDQWIAGSGLGVLGDLAVASGAAFEPITPDTTYSTATKNDNPILYWRFNEPDGSMSVRDDMRGRSGSISGTPVYGSPLIGGQTTAEDKSLRTQPVSGDNPTAVSAILANSAWMNVMSAFSVEIVEYYAGPPGGVSVSTSQGFIYSPFCRVYVTHATGDFNQLKVKVGTVTYSYGVMPTGTRHMVVTYDGVGTVRLYFNGTQAASWSTTTAIENTLSLQVALGGTGAWNAYADEFAVYDYVLTPERISTKYYLSTGQLVGETAFGVAAALEGTPLVDLVGKAGDDLKNPYELQTVDKIGRAYTTGSGTLTAAAALPTALTGSGTVTALTDASVNPGLKGRTSLGLSGSGTLRAYGWKADLAPQGFIPLDMRSFTWEATEPVPPDGAAQHSAWFHYSATDSVTLELTASGDWSPAWEAYVQDGVDSYSLIAQSVEASIALGCVANDSYYIRLHPLWDNLLPYPDGLSDVTWTVTPRTTTPTTDNGAITVGGTLEQAPGPVLITIGDTQPGQTITVNLVGATGVTNPIYTGSTGSGGTIEFTASIPEIPAGTYTIEVVVNGVASTSQLVVSSDPLDTTPDPWDDDWTTPTPLPEPAPDTTVHWKLWDPFTDETFQFTHNPDRWTGLITLGNKNVSHDASMAPDGTLVTWQGAGRPRSWEFAGYLDDQALYEALDSWQAKNHRFWLTDHRNRSWLVAFEQFDAVRRIVPNKPWAHDYTMRATYFMGPVEAVQ